MGNVTTREALALRWAEVLRDPVLQDLPYKIELNTWGKVEMSPASNRHARLQALLSSELSRQLPGGLVASEASILTDIGVRVPDVIWGSAAFMQACGETTPYPQAPEICIEITSPSNSDEEIREKTRAYLAAGATEVWIVAEAGTIQYFDRNGGRAATQFPVALSLPRPIA